MEKADVKTKIKGFIFERFPQAKTKDIDEGEQLLVSGILDSLGVLDVVSFIEDEFETAIDDEDLTPENFQSIHSITEFVACKLNGLTAEKL